MTREEIIEELIVAAREWKESKHWASQNAGKLLKSSMTSEEASEVMTFYFDKESTLLDVINRLDEIDGKEYTKSLKELLEEFEN